MVPEKPLEKTPVWGNQLPVEIIFTSLVPNKNNIKTPSNNDVEIVSSLTDMEKSVISWEEKLIFFKQQFEDAERKLEIMGQTWLLDDTITRYFEILSLKVLGPKSKMFLMNP